MIPGRPVIPGRIIYNHYLIKGMEAAGVVIEIEPDVTTCDVGDVVAYSGFPVSAYAEEQILLEIELYLFHLLLILSLQLLCSLRDWQLMFWFAVASW